MRIAITGLNTEMSFDQMYPILAHIRPKRPREIADCEHAFHLAREFRREFVDPNALDIERRLIAEPSYVAQDALRAAAGYGFFSMMIPRFFGGGGLPVGAFMIGLEEIAAGCPGIANLIAVHGLGLLTLAGMGDMGKMAEVATTIVKSEREGDPKLLSTAITEPEAGTDVEDVDFLRTARLSSEARKVPGGYELHGTKVFISNGNIAHMHVVVMPTNRKEPVGTMAAFLVETGTPGFAVGRVEHKMGQKACPAAELVFDGCFVPEERRIGSGSFAGRTTEMVLGASRGSVCAFGAGAARGAFEKALSYARTHRVGGSRLIDQQWVRFKLADMQRNVMIARAAYIEAMFTNELFGLNSLFAANTAMALTRFVPRALFESKPIQRLLASKAASKVTCKLLNAIDAWKVDTASAFGAAAKLTGTDIGITNCHLALDIMGGDGLRRDLGMEKLFRDAKLLQIYEGTNQLNRIEFFKRAVNRTAEGVAHES